MAYAVELRNQPLRFLDRLASGSPADYYRLDRAIDALALDPRPPGAKKLRGRGPLFRIRVGNYRIVYAVFDPDKLVAIEEIMRRTSRSYKD